MKMNFSAAHRRRPPELPRKPVGRKLPMSLAAGATSKIWQDSINIKHENNSPIYLKSSSLSFQRL